MPERFPSIALMGGTFDPIHIAHLVTAEAAVEQFGLDRVLFVPAGQPPHKRDLPVTSPLHRLAMVRLATRSNPRFEVSSLEFDREGPSYTVDTLAVLREQLPYGTRLYFITGADAIINVETWREPERLFRLCHFIAAHRPGFPTHAIREGLRGLERRYATRVLEVQAPAFEVSSTDIRQRVRDGRTIRYLIPEAVEEYIYAHGLYGARPRPAGSTEV